MKLAIVTSNSYFSYLIAFRLLDEFRADVSVVIEARGMIKGKSTLTMLRSVLRRSGLRGFCYKVGIAGYSRLLDRVFRFVPGSGRLFSPLAHAERLGLPVQTFTDANSPQCLDLIGQAAPDLIFAINVYQKLKRPLLSLPTFGIVNCHFGMLPNYRGMSPYMWALAKNDSEIGITAHFMDEEFDTGDIIAQAPVSIRPRDSAYALYLRGCLVAREMLAKIARDARAGDIPRQTQPREGTYYSLPGPECVRSIRKHGHTLVRLRDLWMVTTGRFERENPTMGGA